MIVKDGVVVDAWGEVAVKSNLHSGRKSLLSGLIGVAVDRGEIDLEATLADLEIDDNAPALTPVEKRATVGDLIKARSGIYHAALYETPQMTASKPARGSHPPGAHWHYNNWDFNTLGTIYEKRTGRKIFEAFKTQFADPLRMEDYEVGDGEYVTGGKSIHPAYPLRMSARDLARFALLYLRQGRWRDRRILSAAWVGESTASHSDLGPESGYGYMWWTGENKGLFPNVRVQGHSYYASGYHRQLAIVLPCHDLVVVHRVNTDWSSANPSGGEIGRLLWTILSAGGIEGIGPNPSLEGAKGRRLDGEALRRILPGAELKGWSHWGNPWEVSISPDGTLSGVSGRDGEVTDSGRWRIEGDLYCRKWENWSGGRDLCFSLVSDGGTLSAYDARGTIVATMELVTP